MIVDLLRPARLMTAQALARRLEVSVRTIYRDVADLIGAGVPITGEAGAGYLMRAGYDLPPLMLTRAEAAALMAGARMLHAFAAGADLGRAAGEAMDKITAVMPDALARATTDLPFYAMAPRGASALPHGLFDQIEQAIAGRCALHIRYTNLVGAVSTRIIQPAALFFWGDVWTLGAYCQMRGEVRMFRLDRCEVLAQGEVFTPARAQELSRAIAQRHRQEAGQD